MGLCGFGCVCVAFEIGDFYRINHFPRWSSFIFGFWEVVEQVCGVGSRSQARKTKDLQCIICSLTYTTYKIIITIASHRIELLESDPSIRPTPLLLLHRPLYIYSLRRCRLRRTPLCTQCNTVLAITITSTLDVEEPQPAGRRTSSLWYALLGRRCTYKFSNANSTHLHCCCYYASCYAAVWCCCTLPSKSRLIDLKTRVDERHQPNDDSLVLRQSVFAIVVSDIT